MKKNDEEKSLFSCLIRSLMRPAILLIVSMLILSSSNTLSLVDVSPAYVMIINNVFKTLSILAIGWGCIELFKCLVDAIHQHAIKSAANDRDRIKQVHTKLMFIRNIGSCIIVFITCSIILIDFQSLRTIGVSLLASAGLITAIVGLAAQKGLSILFSGAQISLMQLLQVGDQVSIDSETGVVEAMTFSYVKIRIDDKTVFIVPTNFFLEKSYKIVPRT